MFERFTDRARRVLVLAQEEARGLSHNFIGTEHILLGLISEGEGVGARALESLDVDLDDVRAKVREVIGETPLGEKSEASAPFTPRAKKVLELSLREALQLGHNYIGTEHILLGLVREGEGVAAQVLAQAVGDLSNVRHAVLQLLSGIQAGSKTTTKRITPGAVAVERLARAARGSGNLATMHYLQAILAEGKGVAARVLAALGVTVEKVEEAAAAVDLAGTSDEPPGEAQARQVRLTVGGTEVLTIDDPALVEKLRALDPARLDELLSRLLREEPGEPKP